MNRWTSLLVMSACVVTNHPGRASAEELRARAARVDLTPPMSMNAPLGGYGARLNRPAVGVHDRIFAKALVLSEGTKRFAIVTADVLAFPPPFKPAVMEALASDGWSAEQIMLQASHSHTSIEMNAINPSNTLDIPQIGLFSRELFELTVANVARAIREADHDLVPVTIGTESVELDGWNRNRRKGEDVTDRELIVTRIDTAGGAPLAVLVNWTAHPTFMSAEDMMFSGGWPGHMQRTLEALIGHDVTVLYCNGAEGNQSPVARPDSGASNWEKAERYGRELAIRAWQQWQTIRTQPSAALAYHLEPISLPEPRWHPDFMSTGGTEYGITEQNRAEVLEKLVPPKTASGSLRIGDLAIVGVPGEMVAQLGMQIKDEVRARTGIAHVAIGGLANEWVSYILSPEQYDEGGYEASVSLYGPSLGPTIVEAAIRGAARLRESAE